MTRMYMFFTGSKQVPCQSPFKAQAVVTIFVKKSMITFSVKETDLRGEIGCLCLEVHTKVC